MTEEYKDKSESESNGKKNEVRTNNYWENRKIGTSWIIGAMAVVIILLIGGFIGSIAINRNSKIGRPVINGFMGRGIDEGGRMGIGMRGGDKRGALNPNQQRLSGVVTAINGDSFTIAGGGTTNTVKTTSDTDYDNGTKVAVNDTVTVVGTTNNGTFTASKVYIFNTSSTDSI